MKGIKVHKIGKKSRGLPFAGIAVVVLFFTAIGTCIRFMSFPMAVQRPLETDFAFFLL